jgi:hypothetical protein
MSLWLRINCVYSSWCEGNKVTLSYSRFSCRPVLQCEHKVAVSKETGRLLQLHHSRCHMQAKSLTSATPFKPTYPCENKVMLRVNNV